LLISSKLWRNFNYTEMSRPFNNMTIRGHYGLSRIMKNRIQLKFVDRLICVIDARMPRPALTGDEAWWLNTKY